MCFYVVFFSLFFCLTTTPTPVSTNKFKHKNANVKCNLQIRITMVCHNIRRYGTKCNGCNQGISPSELVRKSRDNKVFHLNCLTCFLCRRELSTGDQLYIVDDNKFMCKEDYLLHKHGQHSSLSGECLNATLFLLFISFYFLLVCLQLLYEQCVCVLRS